MTFALFGEAAGLLFFHKLRFSMGHIRVSINAPSHNKVLLF